MDNINRIIRFYNPIPVYQFCLGTFNLKRGKHNLSACLRDDFRNRYVNNTTIECRDLRDNAYQCINQRKWVCKVQIIAWSFELGVFCFFNYENDVSGNIPESLVSLVPSFGLFRICDTYFLVEDYFCSGSPTLFNFNRKDFFFLNNRLSIFPNDLYIKNTPGIIWTWSIRINLCFLSYYIQNKLIYASSLILAKQIDICFLFYHIQNKLIYASSLIP